MQLPDELEKPPAGTDGSDSAPLRGTRIYQKVYRQDSRPATFRTLRIFHGARFAAPVLQKAVDDVRQHTETLPLWAVRIAQHVNRGAYGYQQAWNALEQAAIDGGASEAWARRVLYRSFADAVATPRPLMPLRVLIGGLH
jgi:hypothetical protein